MPGQEGKQIKRDFSPLKELNLRLNLRVGDDNLICNDDIYNLIHAQPCTSLDWFKNGDRCLLSTRSHWFEEQKAKLRGNGCHGLHGLNDIPGLLTAMVLFCVSKIV